MTVPTVTPITTISRVDGRLTISRQTLKYKKWPIQAKALPAQIHKV